jgi:hypothetical protein
MSATARTALDWQAENVLQLDPNKEVAEVERLGLEWVEKDEQASILEETKKTVLAQLIREEQLASKSTGGKGIPMNQAESNALASPVFESHLKGMVAARAEANRAKVRYDSARIRIELLRSLIAARREEMRLGSIRT